MAAAARVACALALLAAPGLAAASERIEVAWDLAPAHAPEAGEALAARVALRGAPSQDVEVRAWLAGAGVRGAQVWDGAGWVRSDRYQLRWALDADGVARGWIAVRAASLGAGPWEMGVRVRDATGRILGEGTLALAAPAGDVRAGLAPGAIAVGAWDGDRLLALAPVHPFGGAAPPWDLPGRYALRAPAGAALRAVNGDGAVEPLLAEPPLGALRIVELLVDPAGEEGAEFVRLGNAGASPVALAGWWLRGPGWDAVLRGGKLAPGASVAVARSASAYATLTGRADTADVGVAGVLQLPNAGGAVALGRGAAVADVVAWGGGAPPEGWRGPSLPLGQAGLVHRRLAGWPDRDAASDFDLAPWRADWGGRRPLRLESEAVPFARAQALDTALAALAEAREEVLVEVYELTHPALAGALQQAMARGARVRVLVEGAPVGGLPSEERALLDGLAAGGADVRRIGGSGRDRYATMHAKFAVIDHRAVLLGSENWTPSGFPANGGGNLGWGAWVRSAALADELAAVWAEDADLARGDVARWPAGGGVAPPPTSAAAPAPRQADPAAVTLLLAPDNARGEVLARLDAAAATIEVEALQLPARWDAAPNPVVEGLQAAAARGVRVRALLDGAPGGDNRATAAMLEDWAARTGASLAVRLARERVHNKGLVLDGATALVGSLNFGEAAMTWNREAALLVEGPAAGFYGHAFEEDWAASAAAEPGGADPWLLAAPLAGLAAAGIVRARRRNRRGPRRQRF